MLIEPARLLAVGTQLTPLRSKAKAILMHHSREKKYMLYWLVSTATRSRPVAVAVGTHLDTSPLLIVATLRD